MDGVAHLFIDRLHDSKLVSAIATSGAFATPCLVLNASIIGRTDAFLAADERVSSKSSKEWHDTLRSSFNAYPQGSFEDLLATVRALHKAGVGILVGIGASIPQPQLGGLTYSASVHHKLQMLVAAKLTPIEALLAATAPLAQIFRLSDRGRIVPSAGANLLLVNGNPMTNITDALSIRSIW
ncbi:hypothetical protein AOQ84DRAFT_311977, partial [Glonium stellatum]